MQSDDRRAPARHVVSPLVSSLSARPALPGGPAVPGRHHGAQLRSQSPLQSLNILGLSSGLQVTLSQSVTATLQTDQRLLIEVPSSVKHKLCAFCHHPVRNISVFLRNSADLCNAILATMRSYQVCRLIGILDNIKQLNIVGGLWHLQHIERERDRKSDNDDKIMTYVV